MLVAEIRVTDPGRITGVFRVPIFRPPYSPRRPGVGWAIDVQTLEGNKEALAMCGKLLVRDYLVLLRQQVLPPPQDD